MDRLGWLLLEVELNLQESHPEASEEEVAASAAAAIERLSSAAESEPGKLRSAVATPSFHIQVSFGFFLIELLVSIFLGFLSFKKSLLHQIGHWFSFPNYLTKKLYRTLLTF